MENRQDARVEIPLLTLEPDQIHTDFTEQHTKETTFYDVTTHNNMALQLNEEGLTIINMLTSNPIFKLSMDGNVTIYGTITHASPEISADNTDTL